MQNSQSNNVTQGGKGKIKMPPTQRTSLLTILVTASLTGRSALATTTIQFFGDTYLPQHVIEKTETTAENPRIFSEVSELLATADTNVVNFEGVATRTVMPYTFKTYLLRMPFSVGPILGAASIDIATLGNNHAMDFGYMGLFESLATLNGSGIEATGAGLNISEALVPAIIKTPSGTICILSFNRTLPIEFWATADRPGTANLSYERTRKVVERCAEEHDYTFVVFHWGGELRRRSKAYQRELARHAIDGGALAVIGHHSHILQEIEFYKGHPIFYSVGNFAFGTRPLGAPQEGMAVRFVLDKSAEKHTAILTPLHVQNSEVEFIPRLLKDDEPDPIASRLPKNHRCAWDKKKRHWTCRF